MVGSEAGSHFSIWRMVRNRIEEHVRAISLSVTYHEKGRPSYGV